VGWIPLLLSHLVFDGDSREIFDQLEMWGKRWEKHCDRKSCSWLTVTITRPMLPIRTYCVYKLGPKFETKRKKINWTTGQIDTPRNEGRRYQGPGRAEEGGKNKKVRM
jgi:hypothetical protein